MNYPISIFNMDGSFDWLRREWSTTLTNPKYPIEWDDISGAGMYNESKPTNLGRNLEARNGYHSTREQIRHKADAGTVVEHWIKHEPNASWCAQHRAYMKAPLTDPLGQQHSSGWQSAIEDGHDFEWFVGQNQLVQHVHFDEADAALEGFLLTYRDQVQPAALRPNLVLSPQPLQNHGYRDIVLETVFHGQSVTRDGLDAMSWRSISLMGGLIAFERSKERGVMFY